MQYPPQQKKNSVQQQVMKRLEAARFPGRLVLRWRIAGQRGIKCGDTAALARSAAGDFAPTETKKKPPDFRRLKWEFYDDPVSRCQLASRASTWLG
jgi:hypothetical protein